MVRPLRSFEDVRNGCSCDVVDDMGRTNLGEEALSYIHWFLDVRPSRVFEMFSSRGLYVHFVWLGVVWYAFLCVLTPSIEFLGSMFIC